MKKGLIAGAAATAALAAMPMAGVFASVVDTVTLTVDPTCTMTSTSSAGSVDLGTYSAGQAFDESDGTAMTVSCNRAAGWVLTANATALSASNVSRTIPFGAYGTTASVWSAKIRVSDSTAAATIATGWDDYSAPANGTILSGAANTAVANLVVTPTYKAYVDAAQPAGTYSGTITYTFNNGQ